MLSLHTGLGSRVWGGAVVTVHVWEGTNRPPSQETTKLEQGLCA